MSKCYDKIIIFSPKKIYKFYYQFIEAITNSFKLLGYNVTIIDEVNDEFNYTGSILLIIIGNPYVGFTKSVCEHTKKKNITTVLYETEPFIDPNGISRRYDIYNIDYLWTYSHVIVDSLKEHLKCPVFYLPPAYSSLYNYITDTNIDTQPITFVNFKFETRLKPLKEKMPNILNIDNCWTHQSFKNNISKYFLLINIHKLDDSKALEMFRIAPFLSSGFKVISERSYLKDENEYKDFITFLDVSEMPDYIESCNNEFTENTLVTKKSISKQYKEKFDLTNKLSIVLNKMNITTTQNL